MSSLSSSHDAAHVQLAVVHSRPTRNGLLASELLRRPLHSLDESEGIPASHGLRPGYSNPTFRQSPRACVHGLLCTNQIHYFKTVIRVHPVPPVTRKSPSPRTDGGIGGGDGARTWAWVHAYLSLRRVCSQPTLGRTATVRPGPLRATPHAYARPLVRRRRTTGPGSAHPAWPSPCSPALGPAAAPPAG
jgi:hypothetical protein